MGKILWNGTWSGYRVPCWSSYVVFLFKSSLLVAPLPTCPQVRVPSLHGLSAQWKYQHCKFNRTHDSILCHKTKGHKLHLQDLVAHVYIYFWCCQDTANNGLKGSPEGLWFDNKWQQWASFSFNFTTCHWRWQQHGYWTLGWNRFSEDGECMGTFDEMRKFLALSFRWVMIPPTGSRAAKGNHGFPITNWEQKKRGAWLPIFVVASEVPLECFCIAAFGLGLEPVKLQGHRTGTYMPLVEVLNGYTFKWGLTYPTLGSLETHRLKMPFLGDMLVPWRVHL